MATEQIFQLDQQSQTMLNEAISKLEFFSLYKEYVVSNILLRYKDKNLRFDQMSKMFYITYTDEEYEKLSPPQVQERTYENK